MLLYIANQVGLVDIIYQVEESSGLSPAAWQEVPSAPQITDQGDETEKVSWQLPVSGSSSVFRLKVSVLP